MRIADAASLSGVSTSTLRLWEQHGLLQPEYTASGQRRYTDAHLTRIRDIHRLRAVQGLSLAAIRAMRSKAPGPAGCDNAESNGSRDPHQGVSVGARLRGLRKAAEMSLREVAVRTGLAPSFISTLERTSLGASAASLHKLAQCYGTTVTDILATAAPAEVSSGHEEVVRSGEALVLPMLGPDIQVEQLAKGDLMMDCQKWCLAPGAASDGSYSHEGEEFIHVLYGSFEVILDGHSHHVLGGGDSIYFKSTRLHAWCNPGNETTVLLWVNTPPTF